MIKIDDSVSMQLSIETIALEAGVLSNMVDTVKRTFPGLINGVTTAFTNLDSNSSIGKIGEVTKDQQRLIEFIQKSDYMDFDTYKVTVPEGFIATYLEALEVCENAIDYMQYVKDVVLKEFRVYLSVFISNKDSKISSKDNTFKYKEYKSKRDAVNSSFGKLYRANSYDVNSTYHKVIRRNSDFYSLLNSFNKVSKQLKEVDIDFIKQEIKEIIDLIDLIYTQAKENKIETISPEAIQNISNGAFHTASDVETIAACYFRTKTILVSIDNFLNGLKLRFKL